LLHIYQTAWSQITEDSSIVTARRIWNLTKKYLFFLYISTSISWVIGEVTLPGKYEENLLHLTFKEISCFGTCEFIIFLEKTC
jgi:hypothetical protein